MIVNLAIGDQQGGPARAFGNKGLAPAGKVNDRQAGLGKSGPARPRAFLTIRPAVMQAGLHLLKAACQRLCIWF